MCIATTLIGVIYDTVGVLITLIVGWLTLHSVIIYYTTFLQCSKSAWNRLWTPMHHLCIFNIYCIYLTVFFFAGIFTQYHLNTPSTNTQRPQPRHILLESVYLKRHFMHWDLSGHKVSCDKVSNIVYALPKCNTICDVFC